MNEWEKNPPKTKSIKPSMCCSGKAKNCVWISLQILKSQLGMVAPDVEIDDGKGRHTIQGKGRVKGEFWTWKGRHIIQGKGRVKGKFWTWKGRHTIQGKGRVKGKFWTWKGRHTIQGKGRVKGKFWTWKGRHSIQQKGVVNSEPEKISTQSRERVG